jgi:predicted nucleic acid-binding protein
VDTNILIRSVDATDTNHHTARQALRSLAAGGAVLCITPQNLIEFWAVATRPTINNGLGLSVPQVATEIANFQAAFHLVPDTPVIFMEWARIATRHGVIGKQVHDARIVAAMKAHGITHMLTFNTSHFNRYAAALPHGEGIAVVDPNSAPRMPTT